MKELEAWFSVKRCEDCIHKHICSYRNDYTKFADEMKSKEKNFLIQVDDSIEVPDVANVTISCIYKEKDEKKT